MRRALELAATAGSRDEVPVGALVIKNNIVISEGYNKRELLNSPLAHAELIAIQKASQALGQWRLLDCTLYVTLEPCPMCAGAIVQSRIPQVVFATRDPRAGAIRSVFELATDQRLNHRCEIIEGVLQNEASVLLKQFFANKRKEKNK